MTTGLGQLSAPGALGTDDDGRASHAYFAAMVENRRPRCSVPWAQRRTACCAVHVALPLTDMDAAGIAAIARAKKHAAACIQNHKKTHPSACRVSPFSLL